MQSTLTEVVLAQAFPHSNHGCFCAGVSCSAYSLWKRSSSARLMRRRGFRIMSPLRELLCMLCESYFGNKKVQDKASKVAFSLEIATFPQGLKAFFKAGFFSRGLAWCAGCKSMLASQSQSIATAHLSSLEKKSKTHHVSLQRTKGRVEHFRKCSHGRRGLVGASLSEPHTDVLAWDSVTRDIYRYRGTDRYL